LWVKVRVKAYRKTHKKTEGKMNHPVPAPANTQNTASSAKTTSSEEIVQLRKALATALEERDILKQALRIFSSSPA
jgi:transposase-like protein